MATMDDDDYYFPNYIQHAVSKLRATKNDGLATLVTSYIFYPGRWSLELTGPRATGWPGASFVFTKKYASTHHYVDQLKMGEEAAFTDSFKVTPVLLEPCQTMIILSHTRNTCNKNKINYRRPSTCNITDYIQDPRRIKFYRQLGRDINKTGPQQLKLGRKKAPWNVIPRWG
jgi:hypothetical protein